MESSSGNEQKEEAVAPWRQWGGLLFGFCVATVFVILVHDDLFSSIISGVVIGLGRQLTWRGYSVKLGAVSAILALGLAFTANAILDCTSWADFVDWLDVTIRTPFWIMLYLIGGLLAFWLGRGSAISKNK